MTHSELQEYENFRAECKGKYYTVQEVITEFIKLKQPQVSNQRELLVLAFGWVSCIGEQFFDSSKTVEDMVDIFLAKNNCC